MKLGILLSSLTVLACWAATVIGDELPVYYASTEHLNMTYFNPKYLFTNATMLRKGRADPNYYMNIYLRSFVTADNNIKVDFYFHEFLSNEYRRSFVEMHFKLCDLILKDFFFGPALRDNLPGCPFPPGEYHLRGMMIPDLPVLRSFPFRKARIYWEFSFPSSRLLEGYADLEIKIRPRARKPIPKTVNNTKMQ